MLSDKREQIAEEAARIMIEQGERDFHAAKIKASRIHTISSQADLPSNQEVENHIKKRQSTFGFNSQRELVSKKRLEAQIAMNFFRDFDPYLTGPILDGTATKYSPIEIHLFVDAVEEVTIFLMEHNAPFQLKDKRMRMGKNEEIVIPVISFIANDQELEVSVFPIKYRNHSPLSPIDGAPQRRVNIAKLKKLIERDQAPST